MCESYKIWALFSSQSQQLVLVLYWSHNEPYHLVEDLEAAWYVGQSSVFVSLSFFLIASSTALGSITCGCRRVDDVGNVVFVLLPNNL
jgi:hypothetical protein